MGRIDNVNQSEISNILRRLAQLEARSPGGNTSVTEGRLRIAGVNSLLLEGSGRVSGQLYVEGLEVVSGELRVTGTFNMDGDANVSGTMDVSGPLTVQGDTTFIGPMRVEGASTFVGTMKIDGPVTIAGKTTVTGELIVQGDVTFTGKTTLNGDTRLTGDMKVEGGGKVTVGKMTLNPNGGETGNGALVSTTAIELSAPTVVTSAALFVKASFTAEGNAYLAGLGNVPAGSTGWAPLLVNSSGLVARQT